MRDKEGREKARIRRLSIAEAHRDGLKMKEIAERYGISVSRVSQILTRVRRDSENSS
jgi:DNA-directed RNA polymerase specialized sigma subunit